jgi:multicomponent Na+:H+ antiporter subunit E
MTRSLRLPALVIWLALVWASLWGDFGLANLIVGFGVALLVVWIGRPADVHGIQLTSFHPLSAIVFLGYFAVQLVQSNLQVAWTVVSPRPEVHTAIVAVPMHVASDGIVTVVANAVTLTPGTLTVDVHESEDGTPPVIYVHVLQFHDVASVRADVLRLERLAVRAFGSMRQREQFDAASRRSAEVTS